MGWCEGCLCHISCIVFWLFPVARAIYQNFFVEAYLQNGEQEKIFPWKGSKDEVKAEKSGVAEAEISGG